ncbi:hypothetical protein BST83_13365 [Polaribacter filamentus]|uniref:Uncharacterized protein n=1 Tax=Polaribacter filamentus TaxID=53483 RepID=A0A2S7KZI2_9FLAO|nr:hypothetical protein [Polaribacter filamentus]PQB08030.1 hypothetical protein BST83_13365 [Polaribacter filamentus]
MKLKTNTQLERAIGKKHASHLQSAIRHTIQRESKSFSRLALQTKVTHKMKNGRLQRLVLESPKHSFVHHYGFEGVRSNSRYLNLKDRNHLGGVRSTYVLNGLAKEIGSVRADEVLAQINF